MASKRLKEEKRYVSAIETLYKKGSAKKRESAANQIAKIETDALNKQRKAFSKHNTLQKAGMYALTGLAGTAIGGVAGAGLGSRLGPVGGIIGGAVGGLLGGFASAKAQRDRYIDAKKGIASSAPLAKKHMQDANRSLGLAKSSIKAGRMSSAKQKALLSKQEVSRRISEGMKKSSRVKGRKRR